MEIEHENQLMGSAASKRSKAQRVTPKKINPLAPLQFWDAPPHTHQIIAWTA